MSPQFSEVIAKLGHGVLLGFEFEGGGECREEFFRSPLPESASAVKEYFHQPNHTFLVEPDAGHFSFSHGHGFADTSEEIEFQMDAETFGLEISELIGYFSELFPDLGK